MKKIIQNKLWLGVAGVAVLMLVGLVVFNPSKRKDSIASTVTPSPSASVSPTPISSLKPTNTPLSSSSQAAKLASSPPKPTGQVLNKEVISLSSTTPQSSPDMDSSCQTIANASCGLELKGPNGEIKTVAAKASDTQGGVDIIWNAKALGLSAGTWQVRLAASSGGLTTNGDYYSLKVQP